MDGFRFDKDFFRRPLVSGDSSLPDIPSEPFDSSGRCAVFAGVDEAGRGPLAGPVVAAAVILPDGCEIAWLADSKVVPVEQREALFCEIMDEATAVATAVIGPDEIDRLNIHWATMKAMREAISALDPVPRAVLVDGNQRPKSGCQEFAIIKGDAKSACIMAASIVAKVTRDQIMRDYHKAYPMYGFDEHKGYACPRHYAALDAHGPCPIHRRSFNPVRRALVRSLEESPLV